MNRLRIRIGPWTFARWFVPRCPVCRNRGGRWGWEREG